MSEEKEELKEEVKEEKQEIKGENVVENTPENNELISTKKELEETVDRYKRVMAEFENYKKRSTKEREMLYNSILGDIISGFLPVIDNLEKAANA